MITRRYVVEAPITPARLQVILADLTGVIPTVASNAYTATSCVYLTDVQVAYLRRRLIAHIPDYMGGTS